MEDNICVLNAGDHFSYKGFEWICLDFVGGGIFAIMANTWNDEEYPFDKDGNNNYATSSLRCKLLNELLPVLGEDNLLPHVVDLVADTGDDHYGTVTDKVFILSCDEYRKYRKHVPLLSEWVWTCTPWYITDEGYGYFVRIVDTVGGLSKTYANYGSCVLPTCIFSVEKLQLKHCIELVEKKALYEVKNDK